MWPSNSGLETADKKYIKYPLHIFGWVRCHLSGHLWIFFNKFISSNIYTLGRCFRLARRYKYDGPGFNIWEYLSINPLHHFFLSFWFFSVLFCFLLLCVTENVWMCGIYGLVPARGNFIPHFIYFGFWFTYVVCVQQNVWMRWEINWFS